MNYSKLNIAGVIAEFNPFHSGHRYLIHKLKEDYEVDGIVAVMSGNFVQRGEFAYFDKWKRARVAVESGVDLVIQMPEIYSTSSSEYFAKAGVNILEEMGNISYLSFGAESNDIEELSSISKILNENYELIKNSISNEINSGLSYPAARAKVLFNEFNIDDQSIDMISRSNNILAIEYLRNIKNMKPIAIKRHGNSHHQSGTEIRHKLKQSDTKRYEQMESKFFDFIRNRILFMTDYEIQLADTVGDGLPNLIRNSIRKATSFEELLDDVKSKRYTYGRIRRSILQLASGIKQEDLDYGSLYIRPLAFNELGQSILKESKKNENRTIPIINSISKELKYNKDIEKTLDFDVKFSDLYNILENNNLYKQSDYLMKPIRLYI